MLPVRFRASKNGRIYHAPPIVFKLSKPFGGILEMNLGQSQNLVSRYAIRFPTEDRIRSSWRLRIQTAKRHKSRSSCWSPNQKERLSSLALMVRKPSFS